MRKSSAAGLLLLVAGFSGAVFAAAAPPLPTMPDAKIDRWDPALDAIVPKDWKIEKLADGFGWTEGPIWVKSGHFLIFSDVPGNKMWKWSAKGGLVKVLDPSGAVAPDPAVWREAGSNGIAMWDAKTIVYADTGNRMIQTMDVTTKKRTPVATSYAGKKFSSPNDVIRMKNGVLFFTDPPYGFKKFDDAPEKEQPFNGVYRRAVDGTVTVIEKELVRPNGVALSPDESILYITQSEPTKALILAYSLDKDGNVTGKRVFLDVTDKVSNAAPGLPDGITVAADGTVFSSGPGGIWVISKDGKPLGRINDGKPTANCKFGDDGKTLYLTSKDTLARIRLNVKGIGF